MREVQILTTLAEAPATASDFWPRRLYADTPPDALLGAATRNVLGPSN